jgi:outer membrane protein assembly factor BamB
MSNKSKRVISLAAAVFVLNIFAGLEIAQASVEKLVSGELAKAGGFEIVWESKIPVKEGESLEKLVILGDKVYGLTDKNYVVSMDRQKGTVIFSREIAPAGLPINGFDIYDNEVYSIVGGHLEQLDPDTGRAVKSLPLGFESSCAASRNQDYFYVADNRNRMHVLRADDKVKLFDVAAENESRITSILAGEGFVIFSTAMGDVIAMKGGANRKIWHFNAEGEIVESMIASGDSIYFACKDTNVYSISVKMGRLNWKYGAGVVLDSEPVVTEAIVYQNIRENGLVALDKANGKKLWKLDDGSNLLCESRGRAYVMTRGRKLVVMNNRTGEILYSMNLAKVDLHAVNRADSSFYIADENGRVACLRPAD